MVLILGDSIIPSVSLTVTISSVDVWKANRDSIAVIVMEFRY
jgi:hypothetical protein